MSTELTALMPLEAPLSSGHSDVAIGSRLSASARVVRGPKREFVSRSEHLILRSALGARFSDAQRGFRALLADVAHRLLPFVADAGWFFDAELLVIAERAGLRIREVPVDRGSEGLLESRLRALASGAASTARTAGKPRPRTVGAGCQGDGRPAGAVRVFGVHRR